MKTSPRRIFDNRTSWLWLVVAGGMIALSSATLLWARHKAAIPTTPTENSSNHRWRDAVNYDRVSDVWTVEVRSEDPEALSCTIKWSGISSGERGGYPVSGRFEFKLRPYSGYGLPATLSQHVRQVRDFVDQVTCQRWIPSDASIDAAAQ
jgi:hypothetical protein